MVDDPRSSGNFNSPNFFLVPVFFCVPNAADEFATFAD